MCFSQLHQAYLCLAADRASFERARRLTKNQPCNKPTNQQTHTQTHRDTRRDSSIEKGGSSSADDAGSPVGQKGKKSRLVLATAEAAALSRVERRGICSENRTV
jgi:hypothetical protein